MIRLAGHNLPDDKRIEFALTSIYGIGWKRASNILSATKIDPHTKVADLSDDNVQALQTAVSQYRVEGDLREEVNGNIKRLKEIGSYRGLRHARSLPGKGQRTRSNARTRRGKRKTVGSFTKEDLAKMQTKK
jgi:small subunit ribosomal protein S13